MNRAYQPSFMGNQHEKLECVNPSAASYRFEKLDKTAAKHLSQQGFVVIKSILDSQEVIYAKSLVWNFLSDLGWRRGNPETWNTSAINPKGIIWANGAGQSNFQWFIRTRPKVVKAFADIWSMQPIYAKQNLKFDYKRDMLTSFDGFSIFRPWYLPNIASAQHWKTQSGWYHIDQNIVRSPEIETIQGIVSLYDQDKSTGSTVFVPGSHKWVASLVPNLSIHKKDFVMIARHKLDATLKKKILLCCKAGDLVLWDARCIHCNSPAIMSEREMRKVHSSKLLSKKPKRNSNSNHARKSVENSMEIIKIEQKESNASVSKTEKRFFQSMRDNYLKAKVQRNLSGMKDRIAYNGYLCEVVLFENFNSKLLTNGKSYLFCLPWNTSLLWIPQWLDKITAQNLKKCITQKIKFEEPMLRFDRKNKNGEKIGVKEVKQNRNTAWICNDFHQCIQNRADTDILPAIKLEEWSHSLLRHASNTASNQFNAMLLIHYLNGSHSIGLHSDNDYGLGCDPIIGSLSLGQKRTFFLKSKQIYGKTGKKIEIRIPLTNGSFVLMNGGFQTHWLHSIPKEKQSMGDRINVTFRKYALQKDELKTEMSNANVNINCADIDDINVASVLRAVSFVCMSPKIKVKSKDIIRQRMAAFETMSTCSHWPQKCQILYKPKNMRHRSVNQVRDELVKSLIGMDMLTDKKYENIPENAAVQTNFNHGKFKGKQKNKYKKQKKWQRR